MQTIKQLLRTDSSYLPLTLAYVFNAHSLLLHTFAKIDHHFLHTLMVVFVEEVNIYHEHML